MLVEEVFCLFGQQLHPVMICIDHHIKQKGRLKIQSQVDICDTSGECAVEYISGEIGTCGFG